MNSGIRSGLGKEESVIHKLSGGGNNSRAIQANLEMIEILASLRPSHL